MLFLLVVSGLLPFGNNNDMPKLHPQLMKEIREEDEKARPRIEMFRRMAVPQLILSFLVLITAHVQIINRLSSGYPLWHMFLALTISKDEEDSPHLPKKRLSMSQIAIMYALIQCALYANFLPPA